MQIHNMLADFENVLPSDALGSEALRFVLLERQNRMESIITNGCLRPTYWISVRVPPHCLGCCVAIVVFM